jgi:hypothetical protein
VDTDKEEPLEVAISTLTARHSGGHVSVALGSCVGERSRELPALYPINLGTAAQGEEAMPLKENLS